MMRPTTDRFEDLGQAEQWMLGLAFLLPLLWVAWSRTLWMPGWASVDEAGQVAQLQLWREGWSLPWRLGGGSLHRSALYAWLNLAGWQAGSLRSFGLLLFLAESSALLWLAQGLLGARAAVWAVCVNAFSALTFTRMGSVLWFQALPLEACLMLGMLYRVKGWPGAWAWGLACGLLLFDYDAWVLALPGLALLFAWRHRQARWWAAALAGFALGSAAVLLLNRDWYHASYQTRVDQTLPPQAWQAIGYLGQHLCELVFGGGRALLYLGVPEHPQIAPWAWVGLFASWRLWRAQWPWVAACIAPLAALALHSTAIEPNRCLAAWPFFCLFAGAGFAQLSQLQRSAKAALIALALLGFGLEARAQSQGFKRFGPLFYAESWNQLEAGKALRSRGDRFTLLSDLGPRTGADLRFALGLPPAQLASGPVVAVLPWQDHATLDPAWGAWQSVQAWPEQGPILFLTPAAPWAPRLQNLDARQAKLWPTYYTQPLDRLLRQLEAQTSGAIADPLERTALWEARFQLAAYLGQALPDEGPSALKLQLLRIDPLVRWARRAQRQGQVAEALSLAEAATRQDPRRQEAWQLRLHLLQEAGRAVEADALRKHLIKSPDLGRFQPLWLQD